MRKASLKNGKIRLLNNHERRIVTRAMATDSPLPPCYLADILLWDEKAQKSKPEPVAFLNIHEAINNLAQCDADPNWVSCTHEQMDFSRRVDSWCERVGTTNTGDIVGLSLWVDEAPTVKRSGFFYLLSVLSLVGTGGDFVCVCVPSTGIAYASAVVMAVAPSTACSKL